jgi:hypothetical protein
MAEELTNYWEMSCTNVECLAYGWVYPTDADEIECGGCNVVYSKSE